MNMKCKTLFTNAMGIFTVLLIVVGVWSLANHMLDRTIQTSIDTIEEVRIARPSVSMDIEGEVRTTLTLEEIKQVLLFQQQCSDATFHEPVEGQLSIEEAIATSSQILEQYAELLQITREALEGGSLSVSLIQYLPPEQENFMESKFSFWHVTIRNNDAVVSMKIHALTGELWQLDISAVYEDGIPTALLLTEDTMHNIVNEFMDGISTDLGDMEQMRPLFRESINPLFYPYNREAFRFLYSPSVDGVGVSLEISSIRELGRISLTMVNLGLVISGYTFTVR